jgi:hypothetical protein
MKRKIIIIHALLLGALLFSCKQNKDSKVNENSETSIEEKDDRSAEPSSSQVIISKDQIAFAGTWSSSDYYPIMTLEIGPDGKFKIQEAYGLDAEKGIEYQAAYKDGIVEAIGDEKDFYKWTLPTFEFVGQNMDTIKFSSGVGSIELIKTNKRMPNIFYYPAENND